MEVLSQIRQFDHVGITVADLDSVTAFFADLGLEVEGRTFVEGEFIETVIGIPDSRTEIVMPRPPEGGAGVELASFVRPDHEPGSPSAMANELGLRSICFEVDDLQGHCCIEGSGGAVTGRLVGTADRGPDRLEWTVVRHHRGHQTGCAALSTGILRPTRVPMA